MLPSNGLNFHPEVRDAVGQPPPHLVLAIRAHCLGRYTATVRIFTADAELWREDHVALNGGITRVCPGKPSTPATCTDEETEL